MRNIIYEYLNRIYQTDILGDLNTREFFCVEESLFSHKQNKQIWLLGIINNSTKEFRIEGTYSRDAITLEKILTNLFKKEIPL